MGLGGGGGGETQTYNEEEKIQTRHTRYHRPKTSLKTINNRVIFKFLVFERFLAPCFIELLVFYC